MSSTKFSAEIALIGRRNLSNRSQNRVRFQELEATLCQSHLFPVPDSGRTPGVPRSSGNCSTRSTPGQKQLESTVRGGGGKRSRATSNEFEAVTKPRQASSPPFLTLLFDETKGSQQPPFVDGEAR